MDLTCPKCQGAMRTYERNGVHVDQCTDCRGIFLDRGELERLVDAENAWHTPSGDQGAPARGRGTPASSSGGGGAAGQLGAVVGEALRQAKSSQGHGGHGYGQGYGGHGYPPRRKKSFLDELFG